MLCRVFSFSMLFPLEFTSHLLRSRDVLRLRCLPRRQSAEHRESFRFACNKRDIPPPHECAFQTQPPPTGSQSPKSPNAALRRRARILAFAFWSARADNHTSKSDERTNVFTSFYCIRVDTQRARV